MNFTNKNKLMRLKFTTTLFFFVAILAYGQKATVTSPNKKISVAIVNEQNNDTGKWHLKINYAKEINRHEVIPKLDLGLSRTDQDLSKELKLIKGGKPSLINESYTALHGKRSQGTNSANDIVISFENPSKANSHLII